MAQSVYFLSHYSLRTIDWCNIGRVATIDMLPDDALREIFDFFVNEAKRIHDWSALVHVCRKWREMVFGSSRCLNLRLVCSEDTRCLATLANSHTVEQ
jgi:hypothetical protein